MGTHGWAASSLDLTLLIPSQCGCCRPSASLPPNQRVSSAPRGLRTSGKGCKRAAGPAAHVPPPPLPADSQSGWGAAYSASPGFVFNTVKEAESPSLEDLWSSSGVCIQGSRRPSPWTRVVFALKRKEGCALLLPGAFHLYLFL